MANCGRAGENRQASGVMQEKTGISGDWIYMRLRIFSFTYKGEELANKVADICREGQICDEIVCVRAGRGELRELTKEAWALGDDMLFIGATGIAVRAIVPYMESKLTDRAVLVMDEAGRYVIPILSGHVGGANRLAERIAELTEAAAVITTATDVRGLPAIDEWATDNGYSIMNKDMIAEVTGRLLSGEDIRVSIIESDDIPDMPGYNAMRRDIGYGSMNVGCHASYRMEDDIEDECTDEDVIVYGGSDRSVIKSLVKEYDKRALVLIKKSLILGIGCKRGISASKIEEAIDAILKDNSLDKRLVSTVATIDIKKDEPGILDICARNRWSLFTYSADELKAVEGDFISSDFVKEKVGVDNVCERAAVKAGGRLVAHKESHEGVTVAVAVGDKAAGDEGISDKAIGDKATGDKTIEGKSVKANESKQSKAYNIYIVGIGPGGGKSMTIEAGEVLGSVDTIVGYETYLDLVRGSYPDKEYISTSMRRETERCRMAYEEALKGKNVAVICSGDAGVYGMASLMYELLPEYRADDKDIKLTVIPGVSAALSGAALLGAPIGHDFCVISLSDLMTPWEVIARRLRAATEGDFCIVLYNPSSRHRADYLDRVYTLLSDVIEPDRVCGIANMIGREGENKIICRFDEVAGKGADMFSTVFIGSSRTVITEGHMVTPRGYGI